MKEQSTSVILPPLPIVGILRLSTRDGKSLSMIEVAPGEKATPLNPFFQTCLEEISSFLNGKTVKMKLKLDYSGLTPFQINVLKVMKKIPYGKVIAYRDIAEKMGSRAYQAIGSACGRNPFMLIHPCHRVVGSKDLGGFAHGLEMKKELLQLEARGSSSR